MSLLQFAFDRIKEKVEHDCIEGNIGSSERILSVVSGGFIFGMGLKRIIKNPLIAFSAISLGGTLVYRGVTGHCTLKEMINKEDEESDVTVVEHRYFVR